MKMTLGNGSGLGVALATSGGLIDFDDVSVVMDRFWSGCRGLF
jgi:hypothetical protein